MTKAVRAARIGALILLIFLPTAAVAQLKSFGYAYGAEDAQSLASTYPYTNFSETDGTYGQSLVNKVATMRNVGVQAMIDLGGVLWVHNLSPGHPYYCPNDQNATYCLAADYSSRWQSWVQQNSSVLDSTHVLAFSVIDEPTRNGIPDSDVNTAATLVKTTFPLINTFVVEAAEDAGAFKNSPALDWVGLDEYAIHPGSDSGFQSAMALLKSLMYPDQKIIYVMDAWWTSGLHGKAGFSVTDMGPIAQEWSEVAAADPQAAAMAAFIWPSGSTWTGSQQFPQSVLDYQMLAGQAIASPPTANLVFNSSFEMSGITKSTGWSLVIGSGSASISQVAPGHSGYEALQVVVATPGDVNVVTTPEAKAIPVVPGTVYTYSAYLLSSGGAQAGLRLIEQDATGAVVRDNFLVNGGGTGSWELLTTPFTPGPTTRFVSLRLTHTISAGTFKWDDIFFGTSNLAPNPSFELLEQPASLTGWGLEVLTGAATLSISSSAHSGAQAAQVNVTTPGDVDLYTPGSLVVTPGNTYTYSAYLLSSGGAKAGLRVIEEDATGTPIKDNVLGTGGGTGAWTLLSSTLTVTSKTHSVSLLFVHDISAGTFTWDDVSFVSTNLAYNPSFELGSSTSITGWRFNTPYGYASKSVSSTSHSGGRAVQIIVYAPDNGITLETINAINNDKSMAIPVTPNTSYTYSAYLLSSGGSLAGLEVLEEDATGAVIRDNFLATGGGTGAWSLLTSPFTTMANTQFVSLRLVHNISRGTFIWDDVSLTKN